MPPQGPSRKPNSRWYSEDEKKAVRLVRQLRAELGTEHGKVQRVADQLGYGVESVWGWVRQADIDDGAKAGVSTERSRRGSLGSTPQDSWTLPARGVWVLVFDWCGRP